jgi:hypothetical protein
LYLCNITFFHSQIIKHVHIIKQCCGISRFVSGKEKLRLSNFSLLAC